jgi:hypothetical protein
MIGFLRSTIEMIFPPREYLRTTAPLTAQRQRNAPEPHPLPKLRSINMPGYSIAAVYFGRR